MSKVYFAIEILLDAVVSDHTPIGLKGNAFRWITDRPGYDGSTVIPTWGTKERLYNPCNPNILTPWFEGILTKDGIDGNPARDIDVSMAGNFGSMSGLSFTLRNDQAFLEYCDNNNIEFFNRVVNFYVVINDVFYQFGKFVVANNPVDEITLHFECQDESQADTKQMPPNTVTATQFPTSTNLGDAVPICIGDIAHAKLANTVNLQVGKDGIVTNSIKLNYFSTDGTAYSRQTAAARYYDGSGTNLGEVAGVVELALITAYPDPSAPPLFQANALQGMYLAILNGDGTIYKIRGNARSTTGFTRIYLERKLPYSETDFNNNNTYNTSGYPSYKLIGPREYTLWFEIFTMDIEYKFSEVEGGVNGAAIAKNGFYPALQVWDSASASYENIGDIVDITQQDAIKFLTNNVNLDGKINNFKLVDSHTTILAWQAWASDTDNISVWWPDLTSKFYWPGGGVMTDANRMSELNINNIPPSITHNYKHYLMGFDILVPAPDVDSLYVGIDLRLVGSRADIFVLFQAIDIFNREIPVGKDLNNFTQVMADSADVIEGCPGILPNEYYGLKNGDSGNAQIGTSTTSASIGPGTPIVFVDLNLGISYGKWIKLQYDDSNYMAGTVIAYDDSTGRLWFNSYSYIGGGTHTSWKLYYYATSQFDDIISGTTKVSDAIKVPDKILSQIKSRYALRVWFYLRSSQDTQFQCNLREVGVFGMKAVDTIQTTLYAEVEGEKLPDGSESNNVYTAFRVLMETYCGFSNVNYGNLPIVRSTWPCGRQLYEQRGELDYITELAKQSFVGVFTNRIGYKELTAWLDNPALVTSPTHNQATIIRDSINNYQRTDVANLFNEFTISYSWNPGANKFDVSYSVKHADAASFPLETAPLWKEYCGGPADLSYTVAKELWTYCATAYQKNKMRQPADSSLTACYWYNNPALFNESGNSAYNYLLNLVKWTTRQKETVEYYLPLTQVNIESLDLLTPINFSDIIFTGGNNRIGWITAMELDARNDQIKVSAILYPSDIVEQDNLIIEIGVPLNDGNEVIERGTPLNDGNEIIEGT